MPLDATRWQIEIAAADRTAQAFASVDRRMKSLDQQSRAASSAMTAGFAGVTRLLGPLAAAFSAAAVAQKAWAAGMAAANLPDQAAQLGVTTDALQGYRAAALTSGVAAGELDSALQRLTASMGAANEGSAESIERFDKLGVKLLDANGKLRSVSDVLPEVARGLLNIGSETERNALAQEVLGRSGAKTVTMLEALAQGTDETTEAARRQGMLLESDTIKAWSELDNRLKVVDAQFNTLFATLAKPVAMTALAMLNVHLTGAQNALAGIQKGAEWLTKTTSQALEGGSSEDLIKRQETIKATIDVLKDSTDALDVAKVAGYRQELERISNVLAGRANVYEMPPATITAPAGVSQPIVKSARGGGGGAGGAVKAIKDPVDEVGKLLEKLQQEAERAGQALEDRLGNGAAFAAREAANLDLLLMQGVITLGTHGLAMEEVAARAADMDRAFRGAQGGAGGFFAGMQQAVADMERANSAFEMGRKFTNELASSITELATSADADFNKILASFVNMLAQMAMQAAISSLFSGALGLLGGGGGGGAGGLISGLLGLLGFAEGGRPPVGVPSWVGEHGKELFVPDQAGTIIPTDAFTRGAAMGGGAGPVVHIHQTVHVGEFVTTQQFAAGLSSVGRTAKEGAMQGIIDARKRGGLKDVFK